MGSNDLIQYLFAASREDQDVGYLYHPLHPAVLRVLKQIVEKAAEARRPVSICGDMAGDPAVTWILMGLGLRNLSMDPLSIPVVKSVIRATRLDEAQRLTQRALSLDSAVEIEGLVASIMEARFPLEISV